MSKSAIMFLLEGIGLVALIGWLALPTHPEMSERIPIPENDPANIVIENEEPENPGTLIPGDAVPSPDQGSWSQFRGVNRDAIVDDPGLPDKWYETEPRVVWKMTVGEGHAGAVIHRGCLYLVDYDEEAKEDVIRCLSLDEGKEVWRYSYSSKVKRNHGMSRTVPAVSGDYLVTLGPKCDVHCFHPMTGELYWEKDLVKEYGTRVPEWYAGQCPLIEKDRVILAPGGKCLLTAIDLATGDTIWETPNDQNWDMTHVSIVPYEFEGEKHYAWCATGGALGVNAETGKLLWTHPDWQIKIANIPSPVDVGGGKIFLSGGYNAGSEMLQILKTDSGYTADSVFKTEPTVFGSDQQTPIFLNGFLYGVIPGGKLACLDLNGNQQWVDEENLFGLGPYMAINGKLLVLDDNEKKPGELTLFDVSPQGATRIAGWKAIEGHDAWAPVAYAGGKLILRDATTLICMQLAEGNAI
ncbi:MAG: PQQ-like beta-propeller repeat protein [Candidatus Omnitrophica bacterium]|nr:PQQ-like beta-propeller repeat protein [Candidatus Omnitrophota bacterium]